MEAAKLLQNQIGADYKMDIYILQNKFKDMLKIDNSKEFGRFFADEDYIVDIQGKTHRYMVIWQGRKLVGEENSKLSETLTKFTGGEVSSSTTRTNII